jgi:glycosyltransferase involved in cell wall biosynthesis
LEQDGVDVDVLIVDDASPDGSAAVAEKLAADDPRVRVRVHEVNAGHIATYNDGLSNVDGEYVVLLSADDLLARGSLARSVALMEANPEVGFVYGFSPSFSALPLPQPRSTVSSWSVWDGPEWIEIICARAMNPVRTPDAVMRRSVLAAIGGYEPKLGHAGDLLMWLQAGARGAIGRVNGVDQAFYRTHGANMHVEVFGGELVDLDQKRQTFEVLFADDLLAPGSLARSVALMEANPEVGFVYGFSPSFSAPPVPPPRATVSSWSVWDGPEWIEIICARAMNPVRTPDAVMRRSVLAAIGGYEPKLGHAGDLLMWLQAGARGAIGRVNGVDQAFYRTHGANMHVEVFGGELVDLDQKRQTFEVLFADERAPVPDGERLHGVARRALAREALLTAHRLLARNSLPWDEVEKFVAFARETWPPITTTRLWRTHERYAARVRLGRTAVPPATVRAQRAWEDVAGPLRWRRWRHTGIMPAYGSI